MILECPFCKATVTSACVFYQELPRRAKRLCKEYFVKCARCRAKGPPARTYIGAGRVWNKGSICVT